MDTDRVCNDIDICPIQSFHLSVFEHSKTSVHCRLRIRFLMGSANDQVPLTIIVQIGEEFVNDF